MQKTLGGDRLGSGKKMKVNLHGYERSTHDLGYLWRSTMAAGTLVPFIVEVALPGDTFDINLDIDIKTHPTIGPLFGSYKIQADVFQAPVRLYQGDLHNNKLGIGMNMSAIKLPIIKLFQAAYPDATIADTVDLDNSQINPSCLLAYLGIRGIGFVPSTETTQNRNFNGIPLLAYWDIYKNYYANKQEEIGAALNTTVIPQTITSITIGGATIDEYPDTGLEVVALGEDIIVNFTGAAPNPDDIYFNYVSPIDGTPLEDSLSTLANNIVVGGATITADWNSNSQGVNYWKYASAEQRSPEVSTFDLANIDTMREEIMKNTGSATAFEIQAENLAPYNYVCTPNATTPKLLESQQGLGLKTYQSDLFNNWLQTEWIDGAGGIAEVTAIDTSGGSFTIDTLNLSRKVYDMLNRIAVSGGTYDDWLDAVYTHDRYTRCESPMYMGGLIKELIFQEVISNADSEGQPLGTLAGRGIVGKKHKGGKITVKVDEPSYIIGIISLTPRIDYSQGNKWDVHLLTMDDFHKPALDEIGFQELTIEQMAWWTTKNDPTTNAWTQLSAGKQPAWINYMTNVNKVYGNFAIADNEMFMTLNRRYEHNNVSVIEDLTTYIDPVKYNHIFAQTSRDAQNFWTQIACDITARRKMSAKIMPNL